MQSQPSAHLKALCNVVVNGKVLVGVPKHFVELLPASWEGPHVRKEPGRGLDHLEELLNLIEKSIIRQIPLPSLFSANRSLMSAFLVRALRTSFAKIVNCNKWLFSSLWNSRLEFQFVQTLEVSFPNIWGLPSKYLRFPFPNILGLRFKYLRFPLQIFGVSLPNIWGLPSNI